MSRPSALSTARSAGTVPAACGPRRFLVLSATMGSGHDTVAAVLTDRLTAMGHQVSRADVLDLLPGGMGAALRSAYRITIKNAPWLYAGIYAAFFRESVIPRPGSMPLAALAADRLLAVIDRCQPHAVVSVFHLAAQVAGRLRERGSLPVPSAVMVTDFAVHRLWLHRGNDLYLCRSDQMAERVMRSTGRAAAACAPPVAERFLRPPSPASAAHWRSRLPAGPAADRPAVLLSTGAWGAASRVTHTVRLLDGAGYLPVVLCGENQRLRRRLSACPHTVALGWVHDMPGLMSAVDVLVDNAAGQTALQALAAGLPVIAYLPIPGHGTESVRQMAGLRLADHAGEPSQLLSCLQTLSAPGPPRDRRIAAGRALFATAADGLSRLEALAAPTAAVDRGNGRAGHGRGRITERGPVLPPSAPGRRPR